MKLTHYDNWSDNSAAITSRMHRALAIASQGTCKQKHGAVLMQGARVLAVGVNSMRNDPANIVWTDPDNKPPGISTHAEIQATRTHLSVPNTTLYLVRWGFDHSNNRPMFMDSKPCDECLAYLVWQTSVKEVVYS